MANPLAFDDVSPSSIRSGRSLAEQLQAAVPDNPVVKALNTVNTSVMVQPADLGTEHQIFLCGDDTAAKTMVLALLADLGWQPGQVLDLGDLDRRPGRSSTCCCGFGSCPRWDLRSSTSRWCSRDLRSFVPMADEPTP